MRIVHLACVAPPQVGGIGMAALREVTGLRAHGIDASLIAPSLPVADGQADDKSFIERVEPYVRYGNAAVLPLVHKKIREADVVHLHYPFYGTAEGLLWRKKVVPLVMTFHMDAMAGGWKGLIFSLIRRLTQPALLRRANLVLVSSFDYACQSSLASFFSAHPERVRELPLGLDTDFFSPGPRVRERFNLPTDARMIAFVGGLDRAHWFKGLSLLLEAMTRLEPNVHLVVVSDGELRGEYEQRARELGLAARVHFIGRVDALTLRDAYRSADLLAFPSVSQAEAFGLVALEAAACGTPVVASALPGVRTVVLHGETGLLVPPSDVDSLVAGISTVLTDDVLRQRLAVRAREWAVERFSWERHMEDLKQIYQTVCASPS